MPVLRLRGLFGPPGTNLTIGTIGGNGAAGGAAEAPATDEPSVGAADGPAQETVVIEDKDVMQTFKDAANSAGDTISSAFDKTKSFFGGLFGR